MKIQPLIIAVSTLLITSSHFNTIAQESKLKPIYVSNGLVGFGKIDGVTIDIPDYSRSIRNWPKTTIKTAVELKLRKAGFKVNNKAKNYFIVQVMPSKIGRTGEHVGYVISMAASRSVNFKSNKQEYSTSADVWSYLGIVGANNIKAQLEEKMDRFILAYLKANEKKR